MSGQELTLHVSQSSCWKKHLSVKYNLIQYIFDSIVERQGEGRCNNSCRERVSSPPSPHLPPQTRNPKHHCNNRLLEQEGISKFLEIVVIIHEVNIQIIRSQLQILYTSPGVVERGRKRRERPGLVFYWFLSWKNWSFRCFFWEHFSWYLYSFFSLRETYTCS